MQHPDEGTIHTWLDGELPPDDAAELEAHVAQCSECAAAVAEARGFIAGSSRIVSALDIVPGDVIPVAAPRKRSWYNSTQFRAAAAVLFVAGASLVLLRDGTQSKMETVMDVRDVQTAASPAAESAPVQAPAPQPVNPARDARSRDARSLSASADQAKDEASTAKPVESQAAESRAAAARNEKRAASPTAPPQTAAGIGNLSGPVVKSAEPERRNFDSRLSQRVPVTAVPAPAPAPRSAALADAQRAATSSVRMRADTSKLLLNDVVVTGVATAPAAAPPPVAPLRIVRADTVAATVRTRFEVRPGVEIVLTETSVPIAATGAATAQQQAAAPVSKAAPFERSGNATSATANAARVDSITWVSTVSGKSYVLRGPLTKEQLTLLRSRLPQGVR
jgi:anti-sigma factor RsiW